MIVEREVDCGLVYRRVRRRLIASRRSLDSHRLGTVVPATAAWTVRDAVAQLVGIASDLNAQRFDVTDPDEWTARQVDLGRFERRLHEEPVSLVVYDTMPGGTGYIPKLFVDDATAAGAISGTSGTTPSSTDSKCWPPSSASPALRSSKGWSPKTTSSSRSSSKSSSLGSARPASRCRPFRWCG
jgi:hypothetical protein